ncbi:MULTISPECIES: TRAP transporter small permease [Roseobacteraceae]|uniref:TRAP transporter small permease protein n=1 Tax=Pseudosulfitobacter pseudonitzschiae TaxID=1402135 RepID=A0A221JWX3_9RHOB|nr:MULTISPECIES: TRAP transporter small permease [Roseobacteraceae]ASM71130.1 tripartite ATP-independent periplasmic transporter, DctQ component [Pseudosulfitobacter pseudonitzschiae]
MYMTAYKLTDALARWMALLAGLVLLVVVVLTCVSIAGRALLPLNIGVGPINGIYDLTEIGVGAAIFGFLPWCQLQRSHAAVDLFKPVYGTTLNRVLDVIVDLGMLVAAALIAWRLYLGMLDKLRYGETTFIMQLPVWWGYAACLVGAAAFAHVAVFCVIRSLRGLTGRHDPTEEFAA